MATILILIIGIAMFIWRMNANNDSQDAKVTQADQKSAAATQKITQATTEATTEEVTEATEATTEEESGLDYINNPARDENACQSANDFCQVEGNGFSFYYPKYEFNEGSVNDDKTSFSFSSADRETTLNVYKEYNPGNAKDKAREFYDSVDNNSEYNITYHHGSNEYRVM